MQKLSRALLAETAVKVPHAPLKERPIRVLQFGEGNFLRAFVDWMIDVLNEKNLFDGSIRIVQPLPQGMGEMLNAQQGLYTLILRGVEGGKPAEHTRIITAVKDCVNAYTEWDKVLETARLDTLRFVFSNTTEAGISYTAEPFVPGETPKSFPAKVTALLAERFKHFKGAPDKGLAVIPCELINHNGAELKKCILRHAADWQLGAAFAAWVEQHNLFVNTLVDRIVAGYPRAEAPELCKRFGYEDNLLVCGEIFHLWVIEGPQSLGRELPFAAAGLNVILTDDQSPYRERKVRFLNGAHTGNVLAAFLHGFDFVDQMSSDSLTGGLLRAMIFEEIAPTVKLPDAEKKAFAESVIERFLNPFAGHRLLSISLNSVAKWKVRILPSLLDYVQITGKLPEKLAFSLAALIAFYDCRKQPDGRYAGCGVERLYQVDDDADKLEFFARVWSEKGDDLPGLVRQVLARSDFWGLDLNTVPGLADRVAARLKTIRFEGIGAALTELAGGIR